MSSATTSQTGYAAAPALADVLPPPRQRGRVMTFVRRNPTIVLGGALVFLIILMAILAPYLGTVDPDRAGAGKTDAEPSAQFWFGSDMLGRDVYSRVIYGSRVSLIVGFAVAAIASTIGTFIGLVSGFSRAARFHHHAGDGRADVDPSDPAGDRPDGADPRLGAERHHRHQHRGIPARLPADPRRGASLREQPYVEAAVASGTRMPMIIIKHILPNTLAPLMVNATFICASAMITEAALSFIGAGTPPIIPSWGNIMAEGRALWQVKPYIVFFPAIFLCITVLSVNLLGDGLRDALDPRLAKRL